MTDQPAPSAPDGSAHWQRRDHRTLHTGPFIALHQDQVIRPDGSTGVYEYIDVADAVRVVAVNDKGAVALVDDVFYLHAGRVLHLPGGGIEPGETPETAAGRELAEETGFRPGHLRAIGAIDPLPSSTAAVTHLYLATGLHPGQPRRDATEASMRLHWMPLDAAVRSAETGKIREACSVAALLLAARILNQ